MTEPLLVEPLERPPDTAVRVPGSRSFTNRALIAAALADGTSRIEGALTADDTDAMVDNLARLRVQVVADPEAATIEVTGTAGRLPDGSFDLDARLSGTTSRFLLPLLALGPGRYRLDGHEPLRARPMGGTLEALRELGAEVLEEGAAGHLPVTVGGPVLGGAVEVPGDASSQFLSGLLLAAPAMPRGLRISLTTELVARPFVEMTLETMEAFGARVGVAGDNFSVAPDGYRAATYRVEPDAGAAGYFFAAAALTGGRVLVEGLDRRSRQGDLGILDVLSAMGADVSEESTGLSVRGPATLRGGTFDLSALPDTAPTVAALAPFASDEVRVTGVGFIRGHESNRIAAIVTELRRCGVDAEEEAEGFVVRPGPVAPAVVETYDDHRLAMGLGLMGLRVPGVRIADADVVVKTFPGYFRALDQLRSPTATQ
jgi:3-phosphoshikimate 1-carboxyvinyltransferase